MMNNTYRLAASAMALALVTGLLWAASFMPIARVTVMVVCGGFVYLVSRSYGFGAGITVFVASVILSLLIVPAALNNIPYYLILGPWSVFKVLMDKFTVRRGKNETSFRTRMIAAYALKIVIAAVLVSIGLIFFDNFLTISQLPRIIVNYIWVGGGVVVIAVLAFDYILSLVYTVFGRYMPKARKRRG